MTTKSKWLKTNNNIYVELSSIGSGIIIKKIDLGKMVQINHDNTKLRNAVPKSKICAIRLFK